jgi:hypothetical protein
MIFSARRIGRGTFRGLLWKGPLNTPCVLARFMKANRLVLPESSRILRPWAISPMFLWCWNIAVAACPSCSCGASLDIPTCRDCDGCYWPRRMRTHCMRSSGLRRWRIPIISCPFTTPTSIGAADPDSVDAVRHPTKKKLPKRDLPRATLNLNLSLFFDAA